MSYKSALACHHYIFWVHFVFCLQCLSCCSRSGHTCVKLLHPQSILEASALLSCVQNANVELRKAQFRVLWFADPQPLSSGYSLTCVMCLHTRLKMKFLRWLVVLMTYLCVPGFGSKCCDSYVCSDLSDKRRILVGARHRKANHQETCRSRSI